ncbi:heptaprenylglyceryl phosphate synthase [Halorubrum sp. JWXQ-INN 858]|uniref:heptaprenylglyceryl phosphate synthase n=1 Tax=Halorubrum sp. JWXQ-INN 858 TaxID=2690782 RepID=UPI00135AD10E|nr:heptaprenylglyceryl phosphate synthase [Halorubrum sp. JWXQ-INN 858]MWV64075.1 heptaprenylglyceryl phosphate synthase [Halorubrum sp. JWXQ-INN 858]
MSSLDAFAGRCGRLFRAGRSIVRYGLRLDTNPVPGDWSHVTKVDPEERKKLPIAFPRYLAHTDAVSVGGSADVTDENTRATFTLLESLQTPAFHEPSGADHVTRETLSSAAFLAVPQVLNGDDDAFVGTFGKGVEAVRDRMVPGMLGRVATAPVVGDRLRGVLTDVMLSNAVVEAYIVQNPDSAAARESGVTAADVLDPAAAKQRAMAAEYVLDAEVLYLEYSGTYGGEEATAALEAIDDGVDWTRVWYGGGVDSREKATAVLDAGADAVVVGDVFHRVAEEEAALAADYLDAVGTDPDSDPGAAAWLADACDLADTAAARYLSTIPGVDDPVAEARRCLAAGLRARRAIAADAGRTTSDGRPRVGADAVAAVERAVCAGVDVDDPERFAARLVAAAVHEGDTAFPSEKLAR